MPEAFNWSRFNNRGSGGDRGRIPAVPQRRHRDHRAGLAGCDCWSTRSGRRSASSAPQLLYPGGKVQHAGMFLATPGVARHAFRFAAADEPGYFGLALTQRNVIAVTGACMLVRRDMFDAIGRFDEAHEIVNNDLDFCLRAHKAGLLTVYTPLCKADPSRAGQPRPAGRRLRHRPFRTHNGRRCSPPAIPISVRCCRVMRTTTDPTTNRLRACSPVIRCFVATRSSGSWW